MNQTVDEQILEQIRPYIVDKLDVEPADVTLDADFEKDLHADSLDRVEMLMKLDQECGLVIPNGDEAKIQTVGDVVKAMQEMGVEPETFQKKQDVKPVQKPAIQKPSAKETMVTLTNIPQGLGERTKLNCGEITEKQKQDFLASIMRFDPESTNFANHCGFNLYYDKFNAWVTPFDMKRNYKPQYRRNGDKEMVIETMPMKSPECGAYEKSECPKYLADGKCTSPLVKQTVGALLFPDKYGKER